MAIRMQRTAITKGRLPRLVFFINQIKSRFLLEINGFYVKIKARLRELFGELN
jgi:hypothetical protein